ncbi:ribosomal protein S6 kinase delta-1 [Plodia interpunctella]|uniref:ribosomal protein S6 kinase delta-1 n=1 Tax=Plodia interpunctella TaxID=58824 RepID=UPI002367435F|nr:ribosomal protein S6 kinase delta-1 [Plodia interpunctella]
MSARDKWVRRFSVDETSRHQNGFTIYKITSVIFPIESPEAVTVVSVWKRFSDVQQLHKSMKVLHAGLHLRGTVPELPTSNYFKRFQQQVIEERAKSIKVLLEFIAEHQLLFTSTDCINFLETGYPEPSAPGSVIATIRSSLHLPLEETPHLEYPTDEDDSRSPTHTAQSQPSNLLDDSPQTTDEIDSISRIPIYEAADVEIKTTPKISKSNSFASINSLDSIDSDLFDELNKLAVEKSKPLVKNKSVLPDLINFDAPSTSKFEDYHTMPAKVPDSDTNSLSSACESDSRRSSSRVSLYSKRSVLSLSNFESKTKTEDSYVFEAGYMLNLAARCEDLGDYQRAFECYKSGIEKMLIGVQNDTDPQRRALIKKKTNKYISYAEEIYKNHLCDTEQRILPERDENPRLHCSIPISMLKRKYEDLALYQVLAILGSSIMLVLHKADQSCYAMKVIQKVPNNLTEFDEYFHQRPNETRQPILTTVIPYMVPLHAYIETDNLIFLILSYAPGEKLLDYIKKYAKSIPNTPKRVLNLENVFPKEKTVIESDSDNNNDSVEVNIDSLDNVDVSVNDLVVNSKKLLKNVDRVLSELKVLEKNELDNNRVETATINRLSPHPVDVLPPSAVCKWGAEILTALESLHNSGVICRDLNPSNILLGDRGQILLTYFISYPGLEMTLPKLCNVNMYIAPELYVNSIVDGGNEFDKVCDFWSFGAIMYELLCGVPLSHYHNSIFTSHTILQLPDGLSVEVESLLTQLLTYEPSERLGAGKDGIEEIKKHPYFKHIDWQEVYDSWIVPG